MKQLDNMKAWYAAVALLVIAGLLCLWAAHWVTETAALRTHTFQVLNMADILLSDIKDAETGQRGYLLTKDESYLAPYVEAVDTVDGEFEELRRLTEDNPVQQQRLHTLRPLIVAKMAVLKKAVDLEKKGDTRSALLALSGEGKAMMDSIRTQMKAFTDEETSLHEERTKRFERGIYYFILSIVGSALLTICITSFAVYRISRLNEEAHRANIAKDTFLSTVSHEIRTPLNGLLGTLELLDFTQLNHEQQELLGDARDSGRNLMRIIDDVLDHAKIEAGKLKINLEPISIVQLVHRVLNIYRPLASAKGLSLTEMLDPRISASLLADPLRVIQILGNFVSNAIKFTTKGYVTISVDLIKQAAGAETLCFSVKDTGIGIEPEAKKHLFKPFEQASADTSRLFGGTGLGLAISSHLAEMMGGMIEMESAWGVGSTMRLTLTLPLSEGLPNTVMAVRHIVPIQTKENQRVLAVDDHPTNRKLLERQLAKLNVQVTMTGDGQEALTLWQDSQNEFALIIVDCNMPVMDGYTFSRAIREIEIRENRTRTPIIAWTANVLPEAVMQCHAAGMDDVLTKPAELSVLREMLLKWLDLPKAEVVAAQTTPLDLEALDKVAGDPEERREILQDFMVQTKSDYTALEVALKQQDHSALLRIAHRIKGSSRMVGAHELAAASAVIEQVVQQGDWAGLDTAKRSLDQVMEHLVSYLDKIGNTK